MSTLATRGTVMISTGGAGMRLKSPAAGAEIQADIHAVGDALPTHAADGHHASPGFGPGFGPAPSPAAARAVWPIDPRVRMLNHGSYGIVPAYIRARQAEMQARMNADPIRWFKVDQERLADRAREALAAFLNARFESLTFVPNATFGVATILHSIPWAAGDEVVVTAHEYQATLNELSRLARRTGLVVRTAPVPIPVSGPESIVDSVLGQVGPRTRLIVVSHITSASGFIMPVEAIIREARSRGIPVLIDGAHAPGQIPVDLTALAPTYYTASLHKWLCTPKGSGFIYTDPAVRGSLQPLALSCRVHHIRPDRPSYFCDFDYTGTGDTTPNLVIPDAIEHLGHQLPGGWNELMAHNHREVIAGASVIAARCGLTPAAPRAMRASMVSMVLPPNPRPDRPTHFGDALWDRLLDAHGIQVPVWNFEPARTRVIRVSAHLHTTPDDFEALAVALAQELHAEAVMSTGA